MAVHVKVDARLCQGHGLCWFTAERLFTLGDEDGKSVVLIDPVPADLQGKARAAAAGCPEQAITVVED